MLENLETILRDQCRLTRDHLVLAGVSGGPDSLCLMEVLRRAGYHVIVAHFNHGLRPDSDADANTVEQTASRLNMGSVIESGDVRAFADAEKLSLEEAARHMRYRFLFGQARRLNAQAVAVGHTAEDQVETVLMHFIRGAGLAGLKGMSYRTLLPAFDAGIPVVRPLLDVWREETVIYCATHGLRPRYDPSNESLDFFRNRLRHLLIPTLETYNPRFRETIWRTARSLAGDHEILLTVLDSAWRDCVAQEGTDFIAFEASALTKHSVGLQRNLIRLALERLRPGALDISFSVLERAVNFINDPNRRIRTDLVGGLHLLREGSLIYAAGDRADLPFDRWPQIPDDVESIPLEFPIQIPLSGDWKLSCERWNMAALAWEQAEKNEDPFQAWLDAQDISEPLQLRVRQSGDRFEPLGMNGRSIKLSDFFINVKLPQRARDHWPLVCMGDTVVWVPGYRPAHSFRLTPSTRQVLYFSMMRS